MCSKFTGEHPCRNKIALRHGYSPVYLLHIFRTHFPKNTFGGLLLYEELKAQAKSIKIQKGLT